MRTKIKIVAAALANVILLSSQILAGMPPITFESPDYVPNQSVGMDASGGWQMLAGHATITEPGFGYNGGQALVIPADPQQEPWLRKTVDWNPQEKIAFIDFQIKPVADPEGSYSSFFANGTQVAFQTAEGASQGDIWVYHGNDGVGPDPANPSQWCKTAASFPLSGDGASSASYLRVTIRHDYDRNLWDLFMGGKIVAANLSYEGRGPNLQTLEFFGSHNGDTLLDELSADPQNMLFADADKDGLPDAWEIANGSNPAVYDRDEIKPGTGAAFLDLYMDSLWPAGGTNGSMGLSTPGGIPPLTIDVDAPHEAVGSLKGSFSVGSDGAASYSIPIDLPKGTGGMEPRLALDYSSNGGNGLVGLGFSLSGLQAITRGLAAYRKDGFAGALGQGKDRFFLNGERLVCIAGTYGAAGSEYRTEIDSFARITLVNAADSGTSSWKVETKAGLILEFGTTGDSKVLSAASSPHSWLIKKVSDTIGNYYLINYESDTSEDPEEILNHRVKEIKYTGNVERGLEPYCTVSFSYESRPDILSSYSRGSKFTTNTRVNALQVTTGGQLNHRYELDYQISSQTRRSILSQVQKFEGTGQAAPPTLITWNAKTDTGVRTKWLESVKGEANWMEWRSGLTAYNKFIDINGDGLLDRVDHYNYTVGQNGLWVSLNTGSGFAPPTKWYTGGNTSQNLPEWHSDGKRYSGFLDMNGDGRPDRVDHHDYASGQPGVWVSLNNGSGFNPKTCWWSSSDWCQSLVEWSRINGKYSGFIDLNADGLPDKVDHYNFETGQPGIWVSLNTRSGFATKTRWYVGGNEDQNLMEWNADSSIYSGFYDLNGDGRPDRVDHHNYATNTPGIWVSLNTGSGFAAKTKWYGSSQSDQCRPEWSDSNARLSGFEDMNGDGLLDRVDHHNYETNQPGLWVSLNTGSTFAPKVRWYHSSHDDQNAPTWFNGSGTLSSLRDINGDGLPDRLDDYNYETNQSGLWVSLNTGTGFAAKSRWYMGSSTYQNYPQWKSGDLVKSDMVDMNADGLPDRVDHHDFSTGTSGLWVSLNTGTSFQNKTKWYQSPKAEQNFPVWDSFSGFIDLNSDGLPDRLDHHNYQTGKYGLWVSLNKGNGYNEISGESSAPEVVSSITDGFGSEIEVEYRRLNDPTPTEGFGSRVYEKSSDAMPSGHIAIIDARLVVSRYSEPDGRGGCRYKSQRYGDLRYDRINEASLGFGWIEAKDELTAQVSRTETSRVYPFAGSSVYSETKVLLTQEDINAMPPSGAAGAGLTPGWKCLTKETSVYAEKPTQQGVGGTIRRPVQTSSIKSLFDLDGSLKGKTTTTQSLGSFDAYGFVTSSTVTALDGSSVNTLNQYSHSTTNGKWHLGRLGYSRVVKSGGGKSTITKTSTFTYDSVTGLLKSETIEPGHPLSVTTSYTHDGFGNVTQTSVAASGEARTASSTYDAQGRFVISESNQLGHTVNHDYDFQRAVLNSTTDINGNTTAFTYDGFGTLILTHHPDGTKTGETTGYAGNHSLPASVVAHITNPIAYFRAKQSSGSPITKVYLDALGRELVTETTILRNTAVTDASRYSKVYAVIQYDERGRKVAASDAFAAGETPLFTRIDYDFLNRTIKTTHPDQTFDQILTHGPRTLGGKPVTYSKAANRNGQILERWEDQHGRMIQSMDPSGQINTFQHDHEGRLLSVTVGGQTLLTNTWDLLGNRVSVTEANSGTSTSTYNGFGEMKSATNARGQTTTTSYDLLGRSISVTKPEGTFTMTYDGAPGAGLGQPWKTTGPDNYQESVSYDGFGRAIATTTIRFGETFTTSTTYDSLGRVAMSTDAGGLTVVNEYDATYSFTLSTHIGPGVEGAGTLLWKARTFDAKGRAVSQTLAQGVVAGVSYNPASGLVEGLVADYQGTLIQSKACFWEPNGNLRSRTDLLAKRSETFTYDHLNRLTGSSVMALPGATITTVPPPAQYSYDTKGNLVSKSGATLQYGGPRPHAVTSATIKGAARSYAYDDAGHVTSDGKRSYTWASFGQLKSLAYLAAPALQDLAGASIFTASDVETQFDFDAGGNRARQMKKRIDLSGSRTEEETLYLGSYEREIHGTRASASATQIHTKTVHRHSLGAAIYTRTVASSGTTVKLTTVIKDHLGSTDLLLTGTWNGSSFSNPTSENQAFDPWGERRKADTWENHRINHTDAYRTSSGDYKRGYTGHEQLDDSGLIHMNGRIYDPELGRFLSPDPVVQIPEYSQDFNRYSYVLNNPLNATDPSGFSWLSKAFSKIGNWLKQNWRTVVSIVVGAVLMLTPGGQAFISMIGGMIAPGMVGASWTIAQGVVISGTQMVGGAVVGGIMGGVNSALAGGDVGDILRGVVVGAVQGAISSGPLHALEGVKGMQFAHVAGHGVLGGASNAAMGGKFQDGFLSAAAAAAAGHTGITSKFNGDNALHMAARTSVASAIGGTASALGGGKFANGAYTAAFQHLLNSEVARRPAPGTVNANDDGGPDPRVEMAYELKLPVGSRHFLMIDYWGKFESAETGRYGLATLFDKSGTVVGSWEFNNGGSKGAVLIKQGTYTVRKHWSALPIFDATYSNGGYYEGSRDGPAFWRHGHSFKIHIVGPSATPGILFHPDGAGRGTEGCFGIVSHKKGLQSFESNVRKRYPLKMFTLGDP